MCQVSKTAFTLGECKSLLLLEYEEETGLWFEITISRWRLTVFQTGERSSPTCQSEWWGT